MNIPILAGCSLFILASGLSRRRHLFVICPMMHPNVHHPFISSLFGYFLRPFAPPPSTQKGDFSKATPPGKASPSLLNPGLFWPTIHLLPRPAPSARHDRPEGMCPTIGGSAFFGRAKNDGMFRKTNLRLSKTAQSPQVAGVAGRTAFFFVTFFWASKKK